jgi:hypothetical protein
MATLRVGAVKQGIRRHCRNCRHCVVKGSEAQGDLVIRCAKAMWVSFGEGKPFTLTTWRSILTPYTARVARIAQWCPWFSSMASAQSPNDACEVRNVS